MSAADFRAYHWARAGIGSPLEEAAVDAVVSWRELEDWAESESRCQSQHADPDNLSCSTIVTARLVASCGSTNGCARAEAYWLSRLENPFNTCVDCGRTLVSHWRVVPI